VTPDAPELGTAPSGPTRLNTTALLSLLSSVSGFICLWGMGGLLGVVLGLVARSELEHAEGREHGRGLATAGLALGIVNVAAFVIGIAVLATWMAAPGSSPSVAAPYPTPAPTYAIPSPPTSAGPLAAGPGAPGEATRERDTRTTEFGGVTLVDPGTAAPRLQPLLAAEQAAAEAAQQRLVLWTVTPDCSPCAGVAVSLRDRKVQKALEGVRLVRVDVREFAPDLERLGIPIDKLPGFVLLAPDHRPLDYVDGGEWDADVAGNIAPVLGAFVRGTYAKRRHPWRATLRGDETAL
jgi:hypothetical protein